MLSMQISNEGTNHSNQIIDSSKECCVIYVSQPSVCSDSNYQLSTQNVSCNSDRTPVLSIQVNENIPTFDQASTNLVNIVSCFRSYSTKTQSGSENIVQSNADAQPFNVNLQQNILKYSKNNTSDDLDNVASSSKFISLIGQAPSDPVLNHSNVQETNASHDQILISEKETTSSSDNASVRTIKTNCKTLKEDKLSLVQKEKSKFTNTGREHTDLTSENVIAQTASACEIESAVNRATNDNCLKSETNTFRDQRRRERRRERRRVRNRAQHGHHHMITVPVTIHHQVATGVRSGNVAEPSRTSYEILPDVINNHLPPPYTTLPQQTSTQPIHSPLALSPPTGLDDCRFSFPIPIMRRSPSVHSGRKGCCGQILQCPKSLGLIAMIALGGVTCALGGAAWGASGLSGQPSTHLTISLLMIGIGVVLVTISGMAWKITTSESLHCLGIERSEFDHCGRSLCHRNNSLAHSMLCPEFQHRSPPPTYQASMQEYRLRLLLLDRDRQSNVRRFASVMASAVAHQTSTPPPTYRSNVATQVRRPFLGDFVDREAISSNLDCRAIYSNELNIVPTSRENESSSSAKIESSHQCTPENVPIPNIPTISSANHHLIANSCEAPESSIKSNKHQSSNHSGRVTIVTINNYNNENV